MTNKRAFVTAHKAQYAVSTLCRVLEISRGWFYGFLASQPARDQRKADRDARDLELLPKIKTFFKTSKKCYGSKRIHQDLVADGETVSERRVARIMKENKVSPRLNKRRKPVTTDSNHKMSPSPNLLEQEFHCLTPNTVWLADITYIDTDEGWLYLAGVKDMATREIVGWSMEDHMRAELCCDALTMALGRRGPVPGLIHHSDRGSQGGFKRSLQRFQIGGCNDRSQTRLGAQHTKQVIFARAAAGGVTRAAGEILATDQARYFQRRGWRASWCVCPSWQSLVSRGWGYATVKVCQFI